MATIYERRGPDEAVDVAGSTRYVVQCALRDIHCRHRRRSRMARGGRRTRRGQVSQYRAAHRAGIDSPTAGQEANARRHRRVVSTIVTLTCVLGLLFLGATRMFGADASGRTLALGVFLIAVGGALVLNAITVEATTRPRGR